MSADPFHRVIATGETLFREHDAAREAYLIESGSIALEREGPDGRARLATLGPEAVFGEMALLGDPVRRTSAIALEPTVLTVITADHLDRHLAAAAPVLRAFARVAIARCAEALRLAAQPDAARAAAIAADATPPGVATEAAADRELARKRLQLEQELELALERNEFVLYLQPVVRLDDGSAAGFEASLRWLRPGVGRVPPNEFLWVAEESGLIMRIGHWMIGAAGAALNQLQAVSRTLQPDALPLFASITLSARQWNDAEMFNLIGQTLTAELLAPRQLRLQIQESQVLANLPAAQTLLQRCRDSGVKLAVGAFGTAGSPLSYLHRLPVDTLKLDYSSVQDMAGDAASRKIVQALMHLAAELEMETVAEGLETGAQAEIARLAGCRYGQGFLYGAAMPLRDCTIWLQKRAEKGVAPPYPAENASILE